MKKNLTKLSLIFIINLIIIIGILLITDYSLYYFNVYKNTPNHKKHVVKYTLFPKISFDWMNYIFDGTNYNNNEWGGRIPDGIEYLKKGKSPIVIFGCSFAYGYNLKNNQTFSYKLAHILKRPVYNRAISGSGASSMLYQVKEPLSEFYNQVPYADTVIYLMIDDHYRRNLVYNFDINEYNGFDIIHYKFKNNELIFDSLSKNFLKNSYIYLFFHHKFVNNFIINSQNQEKLTDLQTAFIVETKKELEKHWNKKIKFIVIFYQDTPIKYKDILREKLAKNNIIVIDTNELANTNLLQETYTQDNYHPSEAAWNLLTPLIVKELKNKNVI